MALHVKHWQDPVNLVIGLALLASPWLLGYAATTAAMWNAVALGLLIAGAAVLALIRVRAWEEWTNVVLGVWLVASPWLLGFGTLAPAMGSAVAAGLAVAVLALWALGTDKDIGGWWSPAH